MTRPNAKATILLCALAAAPLALSAGWEDMDVSGRKPARDRHGNVTRESLSSSLYGGGAEATSPRFGPIPAEYACPTLDDMSFMPIRTYMLVSPKASYGAYGSSASVELDGDCRLFLEGPFLGADWEGGVHARLQTFVNDNGMDALPAAMAQLNLSLAATWRFVNHWSLEAAAYPGMYSDVSDPAFFSPFSVNAHFSQDPALSFLLGGSLRPGWEDPFIPNVGMAWQPAEWFRLDATLPRGGFTLRPFESCWVYGAIEWRDYDYSIDDGGGKYPDSITIKEWLASVGVFVSPQANGCGLTLEVGKYLDRKLEANVKENSSVEIEKTWFARIGWRGVF